MSKVIIFIKSKFHPLFYLRKFKLYQFITRKINISIAIPFPYVKHKVYVDFMKNLSMVLSGGNAGEELERANFIHLVNYGKFKCFYDIGGNIGMYTFMFKDIVPDGSVWTFEPDPGNAELLRKTIAVNGLKNITIVESAVSDINGILTFQKDDISGATGTILDPVVNQSFISRHHQAGIKKIQVTSVTIDTHSINNKIPDLIKIDVEGAEGQVFEGGRNSILTNYPAIIFECNSRDASLHDFLISAGYELYDFETIKPISRLVHNNLALHSQFHAGIIKKLVELEAV